MSRITDVQIGEPFKWVAARVGGNHWCIRLVLGQQTMRLQSLVGDDWLDRRFIWTYAEGPKQGHIFIDEGDAEVVLP